MCASVPDERDPAAASAERGGEFTKQWVRAQPIVTAYVFSSVRNAHDAEDLVQEAAAAAFDDFARFDPERSFVAWALGIARFRILNYYRSRSSDKLVFDESTLAALAVAHEALEGTVSERHQALGHCLGKVEGNKRRIVELRYGENHSVKSIAEQLDSTPNAISLVLHKLRGFLLDCIEKRLLAAERQS